MSEAQNCTPPEELRRQIMSYSEPKNEREWWACCRIEELEAALQEIACNPDISPCTCLDESECSYGIARAALAGNKKNG